MDADKKHRDLSSPVNAFQTWLDRIDPGVHRRIRGLRLVTAYGIAAMLGTMGEISRGLPDNTQLASLAGGFALWASVSEARATRAASSRDLLLLSAAATLGASSFVLLAPLLRHLGGPGPELVLASGAFLVGYLRRFGVTGAGIGSQVYIGQLLALNGRLGPADLSTIAAAGLLAALASIVPRVLSGPAEHPPPSPARAGIPIGSVRPELAMGLQAAATALVIVALDFAIGLTEAVWAITAATYIIGNSAHGTLDRARQRVIGTVIGVPLGLLVLPLTTAMPLLVWAAVALAMVLYAMALPERYDVACGAYAFTLIATLAISGEHSVPLLASRAWETVLGGVIGLTVVFAWPPRSAMQRSG